MRPFSNSLAESLYIDLVKIREVKPLVLNITNQVASNFSANVLLALGGSPLMAHEIGELGQIVSLANALVLNIGTLDEEQIHSMNYAIDCANLKNIPIIIDPVGSGASELRTKTVRALLKKSNNCILKGNASEINSLLSVSHNSKGVDSLEKPENAFDSARFILKKYDLISVVITGKKDYVICPQGNTIHYNGDEMMTKVTGMGCSLTCAIAAFSAINVDYSQSVKHAVSLFGVVGEIAKDNSSGPGSFQSSFLDTLFTIRNEEVYKTLKVEQC